MVLRGSLALFLLFALPQSSHAGYPTPQAAAQAFHNCFTAKICPFSKVFYGKIGDFMRKRMPRMKRSFVKLRFLKQVPKKWRARYRSRWTRKAQKLAKHGYSLKGLLQVGLGKSVARVGKDVAMGLFLVTIQRRTRTKKEAAYVVMWKLKAGWRVVFIEDNPGSWMIRNKPPAMGGSLKNIQSTKRPKGAKKPVLRKARP